MRTARIRSTQRPTRSATGGGTTAGARRNSADSTESTGSGRRITGINGIGGIAGYNQSDNNNQQQQLVRFEPLPAADGQTQDRRRKSGRGEIPEEDLAGNPYKLNRFGVLEVPGLPAMPLSGLTASEATKRLAADPDSTITSCA